MEPCLRIALTSFSKYFGLITAYPLDLCRWLSRCLWSLRAPFFLSRNKRLHFTFTTFTFVFIFTRYHNPYTSDSYDPDQILSLFLPCSAAPPSRSALLSESSSSPSCLSLHSFSHLLLYSRSLFESFCDLSLERSGSACSLH